MYPEKNESTPGLVPKSFVPTLGQLVPVHLPDSLITSAEMLDD